MGPSGPGVEIIRKRYSSKDLMKILRRDGWNLVNVEGDHHQFRHPAKKGKVTVPHPRKDIHPKTASSILKQAGLK